VNGALKAAWALTAFVIVLGAVLLATTHRVVFIVFIGLGVLTAAGAWFTGRTEATAAPRTAPTKEEAP
jgi:hypothetical protein